MAKMVGRSSAQRGLFRSEFFEEKTLRSTREALAGTGATLGVGGGGLEFDARRIAMTVEYVRRFGLATGRVVEVGRLEYAAARALWGHFPDVEPLETQSDLRTEALDFPDDSIDGLVCLEVIEHLSDVPYAHATTLNGLFHFLNEVYRVLRVGGKALFTTPNAASFWAIQRALRQEPPMMYEWHFREFTVDELRRIMESVGFEIATLRTEFVWHLWDFEPLRRFVARNGYGTDDRGDDVFIVVTKPAVRDSKPHGLDLPI
jgi:SAM-dependent methyltransferase